MKRLPRLKGKEIEKAVLSNQDGLFVFLPALLSSP
jgi:hypothetical protein